LGGIVMRVADVIAFESAWRTLAEQSQKFLLVIEEQRRN